MINAQQIDFLRKRERGRTKFSKKIRRIKEIKRMSFKIKVLTRTWVKDNYGLFDYDLDKDLNLNEFTIKNEGVLTRKLDDTFFYSKIKKQ